MNLTEPNYSNLHKNPCSLLSLGEIALDKDLSAVLINISTNMKRLTMISSLFNELEAIHLQAQA